MDFVCIDGDCPDGFVAGGAYVYATDDWRKLGLECGWHLAGHLENFGFLDGVFLCDSRCYHFAESFCGVDEVRILGNVSPGSDEDDGACACGGCDSLFRSLVACNGDAFFGVCGCCRLYPDAVVGGFFPRGRLGAWACIDCSP